MNDEIVRIIPLVGLFPSESEKLELVLLIELPNPQIFDHVVVHHSRLKDIRLTFKVIIKIMNANSGSSIWPLHCKSLD